MPDAPEPFEPILTISPAKAFGKPAVAVISTTVHHSTTHCFDAANARRLAAGLIQLADLIDPPPTAPVVTDEHLGPQRTKRKPRK